MSKEKNNYLIFLGTGSSKGVPIIGCNCEVCTSTDPKDRRLRSCVFIRYRGKNIVIDTGPDFRFQMLREEITEIDAILYTHEHRDHTGGLDEILPICWKIDKNILIYAEERVQDYLKLSFPYVFSRVKYPEAAKLILNTIDDMPFEVEGIGKIIPIRGHHIHNLPILGFRIGNLAYLTDMKRIPEKEIKKMKNLEILVVNALHYEEHPSHFSMPEAISLIERVKPQKGIITHVGHKMGLSKIVETQLPSNVQLSYDGLKISFS